MESLKQLAIIIVITFVGVILSIVLPLPVPSSIYGLLLLLILLLSGILKLDSVRGVSKILIQAMPIMFIPAGVGLITSWGHLAPILLPVGVITFISTFIVMVVSGKLTEIIIKKSENSKGK